MASKLVLIAFSLVLVGGCNQNTGHLSKSDAEFAVLKALEHAESQEFGAAFTILNPVLINRPTDATARVVRGTILRKAGRYPEAIADLNEAILLDPENADAYCQRAFARQQAKNPDWQSQSIADAGKSIQLRVHNPLAHLIRGTALVTKQEFRQAMTEFSIAIRQNPQSYSGYGGRALAHAELANYAKAHADIKKALSLDPPLADRSELVELERRIRMMNISTRKPSNKRRFTSQPF